MAAKRVRRRREVVVTTRQTPWNATKEQAKQFAKVRKLQNRIHQLEQDLAAAKRAEADAIVTANEQKRLRMAALPTAVRAAALDAIANMPVRKLLQVGLSPILVVEIAKWSLELDGEQGSIFKLAKPIHLQPRQPLVDTTSAPASGAEILERFERSRS